MSWNSGAGSPNVFMCHAQRMQWHEHRDPDSDHVVTLTGKKRKVYRSIYTRRGPRSSDVSRQYECSCGHIGWSNHMDLERMENT